METVRYKAEAGQYRIVHAPSVAVRSKPWGNKVGVKLSGTLVRTDMRTVGGQANTRPSRAALDGHYRHLWASGCARLVLQHGACAALFALLPSPEEWSEHLAVF